jgi:CDP-diacylglycerol--glycerol-3-phosphate 3-phosphatidyltransferase
MVPIFMVVMLLPVFTNFSATTDMILTLAGAFLFIAASFTDMLDGKIARKYNLVTDFGKFMDPLADKLMVFGAMLGIIIINGGNVVFAKVFTCAAFLIIFRELAVTSMRMIVSSSAGIVVAANIFGKLKTVSQIIGIIIILIEPMIWEGYVASYVMTAIMVATTMFSGFSYFKAYWPHINSNK